MARQNENDLALRRVAVQLVAQLPENEAEALEGVGLGAGLCAAFSQQRASRGGRHDPFCTETLKLIT
jgi:hypothetical protein